MLFLTGWLLMELLAPVAATNCYYHNGDVAEDDVPCGSDTNYCCPSGDTCVSDGTHGLCQDANNHLNGSLTYFNDQADSGPFNYTGLYKSASCDNSAFSGCSTYCLGDSSQDEYMWACNDALTSFCCHQDSISLSQGDCCSDQLYVLSASVSAFGTSTDTVASASASASASANTSSTPNSTQVSVTTSTQSQKTASASTATTSSGSASSSPSTKALLISSTYVDNLSSLYPVSTVQANALTSSASTSVSVSAVEQSSSSSAMPSVSWSDLSGGTKIGIAIASLAVLLLGLGVFLLWRKTRTNRAKSPGTAKGMGDVEYSRDAKPFQSLEHPLRCPSCVSDSHHSGRYDASLSPPSAIAPRPSPSRESSSRGIHHHHHQPFLQELPDAGQVYEMPAGGRTWYHQSPNRL